MGVATGLTAALVYVPRAARLAGAALTTLAGADFLPCTQTLLDKAAT